VRLLAVIGGTAVVAAVFLGMVDTLVSTRLRNNTRRRFADWLADQAWTLFRAIARRASRRQTRAGQPRKARARRETILSLYPSVVLLTLIACWVGFQVVGWALIWWGSGVIGGVTDMLESVYYSGVVYFTIGFGDITPVSGIGRMLTLVEGFSGVLFIALTVGYLPNLYGSYARREQVLLLLDDGTPGHTTPMALAGAFLDGSIDFRDLDQTLGEWEQWVAMVLETHTSHPMLAYFRSQHLGRSWATGMGLMADVAVISIVARGDEKGPAWRLYRRCVSTFVVMTASLGLTPSEVDDDDVDAPTAQDLVDLGLPLPDDPDRVLAEYHTLRASYAGHLDSLLRHLDAPRRFFGALVPVTVEQAHAGAAATGAAAESRVVGQSDVDAPSAPVTTADDDARG